MKTFESSNPVDYNTKHQYSKSGHGQDFKPLIQKHRPAILTEDCEDQLRNVHDINKHINIDVSVHDVKKDSEIMVQPTNVEKHMQNLDKTIEIEEIDEVNVPCIGGNIQGPLKSQKSTSRGVLIQDETKFKLTPNDRLLKQIIN